MARSSVWILLVLLLAACDRPPGEQGYPLPTGLRAMVESDGRSYEVEVIDVEDRTATLRYNWNGRVIAERTQYRGLYSLSGYDGALKFVNAFDTAELEALFPLSVGREAEFVGSMTYPAGGKEGALHVSMHVVKKTRLPVEGGVFDVFVIEVDTELIIDGRVRTVHRILYYAPDLGLPLKVDISDGDASSYWRITSIDMPARGRRNRLGTVMI